MSDQGIDACERITGMVNLPIEYSDKPVTPFGGMALMKRFVDQTGKGRPCFRPATVHSVALPPHSWLRAHFCRLGEKTRKQANLACLPLLSTERIIA